MVNIYAFFGCVCHSRLPRLAALMLVALALLNLTGCWAFSPIDQAVVTGDLEKTRALLKDNPNLVFSKFIMGATLLHHAAFSGHKDVAELLLANKADVNAKADDGSTPLHQAVAEGHNDVVELLLAHGADVNAKTNDMRWTPLLFLFKGAEDRFVSPSKDLVELLLTHGANANAKVNGDTSLLFFLKAADRKFVTPDKGMIELLLAHGADVNIKDRDGNTPLHIETRLGNKDLVELLLAHGADVNAKGMWGNTPLKLARNNLLRQDVADLLSQHGGHE